MRTLLVLTAFLAGLSLLHSSGPRPVVAQEKAAVVKWEYAELTFRANAGRPAMKDADGKEIDAIPPAMTGRWTSAAGDHSVKGWDELAEKLKAPFKKEGTAAAQKIQVLNALGADGWELVSQQAGATPTMVTAGPGAGGGRGFSGVTASSTPTTMMFKRRLP